MNLKWLKSHYEETATGDVPTPSKRVKYQTLKDDIELHFPRRTYNVPSRQRLHQGSFSNVQHKETLKATPHTRFMH